MSTRLLLVLALIAAVAVVSVLLLRGVEPEPEADPPRIPSRDAAPGAEDLEHGTAPATTRDPSPEGADPASGRTAPVSPTGITGIVVDASDRPVPAAEVRLEAIDEQDIRRGRARAGPTLATTHVASDGSFLLPREEDGWVRAVATAPGYGAVAAWAPGPGTRLRLVLSRGAAVDVVVVDEDGKPVEAAAVELRSGRAVHAGETDAEGMAHFEGVAPGAVTATATLEEHREVHSTPVAASADATARLTILLPRGVAVEGRVLDAVTGRPIVGADVHLARPGRAALAGPTDADGHFGPTVAGVAGDRVLVAVQAEGYTGSILPVVLPDGDDPEVLEVALETAQAWHGRVVDERGDGVEGARVGYTPDGIEGRAPATTTTDEQGLFSLPPPPPPLPPPAGGRRTVLVARSAAGHAALALRSREPPEDLTLVLTRGARVGGRLTDASGSPRAGLVVRLVPDWRSLPDRTQPQADASRLRAMNETGLHELTTTTDGAGAFRFDDVPDARYELRILSTPVPPSPAPAVEVRGADLDLGTLQTGGGPGLEGRVVDATGRPLSGASVLAQGGGDGGGRARTHRTTSDDDGRFAFPDLAVGTWRLRATLPGWLDASAEVETPLDTAPELVLGEGAVLAGRVRDGETPYRATFVVVVEQAGEGRRRRRFRQTVQDASGRFEMAGVPDGLWQVRVETPRGRRGALAAPVEVHAGARYDLEIPLVTAGSVGGRLRTPEGDPVAAARITIVGAGGGRSRTVTTNAEGRFRVDGLPDGPWKLVARGAGGAPLEHSFRLSASENLSLDLSLGPAGRLAIEVRGDDGKARAGALVRLRPQDAPAPAPRSPPRTSALGLVTIEDVPIGPVEVRVLSAAGEQGRTEVVVTEGAQTRVVVVVSR